MGLSWTAHSVVSHRLASRLALVRLWCLGFSLWMYGGTRLPLFAGPKHLETDVFWVVPASRVAWLPPLPYFFTVGLPANLLGTSSQAPRLAMSLNVANFI